MNPVTLRTISHNRSKAKRLKKYVLKHREVLLKERIEQSVRANNVHRTVFTTTPPAEVPNGAAQ